MSHGSPASVFRKILVVVDRELSADPVLGPAERLARSCSAELTLLDVTEPTPPYVRTVDPEVANLLDELGGNRQSRIESLTRDLASRGISTSWRTLAPPGAVQISRVAQREGFDLVMTSARPEAHPFSPPLGIFVLRLLRLCSMPVLVVKAPEPPRRVLAAVDLARETNSLLASRIVGLAAAVAAQEGASLQLIQAWQPFGARQLGQHLSHERHARYVHSLECHLRDQAESLLGLYPDCEFHLPLGRPSEVIPEFVRAHAIDLIVMSSATRIGTPGALLGSTAERIIRRLDCSLLAVKPEGFESPVPAR